MTQTTIYIIAFIGLALIVAAVLYVGIKQIKDLTNRNHSKDFVRGTMKRKQLQH